MAKKMLVDATHPEETRVVVVDGNKVDDFDFESINKRQLAGNIYLAKVTRVEPSLQAAFVEYGGNRHGFLAFSEIHPDYYQIPMADREALLEEERREEEARRAREEEGDGQETSRSGRKRGRRSRKSGRGQNGEAESPAVAGLEVIEIEVPDEPEDSGDEVPRGLEIAEPDVLANDMPGEGSMASVDPDGAATADAVVAEEDSPPEAAAVVEPEVTGAEPAETVGAAPAEDAFAGESEDAPAEEAGEPGPVAGAETATSEVDAEETGSVTAAKEGTEKRREDGAVAEEPASGDGEQDPDQPPRTIAESAGLDDDERVVGDVEGRGSRTVTGDDAEDVSADTLEAGVTAGDDTTAPADADLAADTSSAPESPVERTPEPSDDAEGAAGPFDETPALQDSAEPAVTEPAAAAPTETAGVEQDGEAGEADESDAGLTEAESAEAESAAAGAGASEEDGSDGDAADEAEDGRQGRRSRRRRGRGRRGSREAEATEAQDEADEADSDADADGDDDGPDEPEAVGAEDTLEEAARARTRLRRKYKIQDVVKVRQIMLVQVVKEERGNKGAALTTYLSLAGRYCVLMPNTARGGGISRKITNAGDRKRLREIIGEMDVPQGMGLIVRTAGAERTKAEIKRDYEFLLRQWEQIRELTLKSIAPTLIYEEGSLIKRSIRDIYNKDIDQILVEGETGYREAKEYMKMLMPSHAKNVQPYNDPIPLFSRYQVESYLNGMFNPTVQLKSGGYIVIGVTEALVAIDVNSGRATKQGSIEETALQTNLEAADEVARQLRLRDLAGLIVIDFIDMDENRNNRAVEKRMKDRLKTDRARIQVGRISAFGLMEMSRQRLRPGMLEATTQSCPTCHGTGLIRSDESLTLSILRELEEEGLRGRADELTVRVPVDISNYLINTKREHLAQIEERHGVRIAVLAEPGLVSPQFEIERSKSQRPRPARQPDVVTAASVVEDDELVEETADEQGDEDRGGRRRRGRRGGRRRRGEDKPEADGQEESQAAPQDDDEKVDEDRPKRRRGRRRGGRGRRDDRDETQAEGDAAERSPEDIASVAEAQVPEEASAEVTEPDAAPTEIGAEAGAAPEDSADVPEPASSSSAIGGEAEDTAAEDLPAGDETATDTDTVADTATEAEPEEPVTEEPVMAAEDDAVAETAPDEPATVPAHEAATRPKRRGWWSFGQ